MSEIERITRAVGRAVLVECHASTAQHRQTHPERSGAACEGVCETYRTPTAAHAPFSATCHFLREMGNKILFHMN